MERLARLVVQVIIFLAAWKVVGQWMSIWTMEIVQNVSGADFGVEFVRGLLWGTYGTFGGLFAAKFLTKRYFTEIENV